MNFDLTVPRSRVWFVTSPVAGIKSRMMADRSSLMRRRWAQEAALNDATAVSRRVFIFGGAAAVSGLAFWGLRRATVAAARPLAADEGPRSVTVVRFSRRRPGDRRDHRPPHRPQRRRMAAASWVRCLLGDAARRYGAALYRRAAARGAAWRLHCAGCDLALFCSQTKFDSGTGWPSFWQPIAQENIVESPDGSLMVVRTAVSCRLCDGHLGHVFTMGRSRPGCATA